jgi:hypothetical protein
MVAPSESNASNIVRDMPVAVVTGAGRGLGRAIALDLAGRGYRVQVTDVDGDVAAATAAEIGPSASSSKQSAETRRKMLEVNVLGTMNGCGPLLGPAAHPGARGGRGRQAVRAPSARAAALAQPDAAPVDAFPSLAVRLVPLLMRDARRRQRRYKKLIESGRWP